MNKIEEQTGILTIYLPVLVTVVIIVLLSATLLKTKIEEIVSTNNQIKQAKSSITRLVEKIEVLKKLDSQSLLEKNNSLSLSLPVQKNIPQALNSLENISSEAQISLITLRINPGEVSTSSATQKIIVEKPPENTFKIDLELEGTYKNFIRFLQKINTTNPIFSIEKISFAQSDKNATDSATVRGQVLLLSYSSPTIKTIGKISDPLPPLLKDSDKIFTQVSKFQDYNTLIENVPVGKSNPFVLVSQ